MDYIYALCDPRDNRIRYIGKTSNLRQRYNQHIREKTNTYRTHWIQSLIKLGLAPHLIVIEEIPPGQDWGERERLWIAHYRSMGNDLTNVSDGGDRGPDCTGKHLIKSEKGRKNIIAALVKRNKSPEMREVARKSGLKHGNNLQTKESIAKRAATRTGKKVVLSDKARLQLIERNKTRSYDTEKMSHNSRKLWDDPVMGKELRRRLAERNKANHWRKGKKGNTHKARSAARKLWDDPISGANARAKLIERNKRRGKKSSH